MVWFWDARWQGLLQHDVQLWDGDALEVTWGDEFTIGSH